MNELNRIKDDLIVTLGDHIRSAHNISTFNQLHERSLALAQIALVFLKRAYCEKGENELKG